MPAAPTVSPLEHFVDHPQQFGLLLGRRKPAQRAGELYHAGADLRLVGVVGEAQIPTASVVVPGNLRERLGILGRLPFAFAEIGEHAFDALEEHADFRHVAAQDAVDEAKLLRGRGTVVDEFADLAPVLGEGSASVNPLTLIIDVVEKWESTAGLTRPRPISAIDDACNERPSMAPATGPSGATDEKP